MNMSLATVSPVEAKRLIDAGAILIDIRAADEHARERIPNARNHPLGELTKLDGSAAPVVFHCRAGSRTGANAGKLAGAAASCEAYILDGGIEAWKRTGLPIVRDRSQPIEIMRQVQIAAGSLVLLGVLLGYFVHPAFYLISLFIGGGLSFAGLTGWCGMAKLLALMPWNRAMSVTNTKLAN
jgi:rhodanese-related sulfurtransferase